ncbi:MAG: hypothetical protein ACYC6B_00510 [Thermoleophilia bacterium]
MSEFQEPGFISNYFLRPVEVGCSWCDCIVPLPAGYFSGVCIDCGAVVFRPGAERGRLKTAGQMVSSLPCPA